MRYFIIFIFFSPVLITLRTIKNVYFYSYDWETSFLRSIDLDEGTVWSKDFSERNFSKVHFGMDRKEVDILMGKPLQEFFDDKTKETVLKYSWQIHQSANFDWRSLRLDEAGKVIAIRHQYYVD